MTNTYQAICGESVKTFRVTNLGSEFLVEEIKVVSSVKIKCTYGCTAVNEALRMQGMRADDVIKCA